MCKLKGTWLVMITFAVFYRPNEKMKKIAIFASGGGSNAQKIHDYFESGSFGVVDSLICNNENAHVLVRSKEWGSKQIVVLKKDFVESDELSLMLLARGIDLIVLAGFLWLVPPSLLKAFPNKIINIHPALLPKYGGKGMHGMHVHEAVVHAKEDFSGITIHYVNQEYDKGTVIFQAKCLVSGMSAKEVSEAVLKLEHEHFPQVIAKVLLEA